MFSDEGTLLSDPEEILSYKKEYYTRLFDSVDLEADTESAALFSGSERVANDEEQNLLNRNFTIEEFEISLKKMHKGKAPGCDGIPSEFYLRFWHVLGTHLFDGLMDSLDRGILSPNQRRGVITLIPKKGKDKRF